MIEETEKAKNDLPLKIELLEWHDSRGGSHWETLADISHKISVVTSVGWIFHEDDDCVTMAGHKADHPTQTFAFITIPKVAIVSREVIRE